MVKIASVEAENVKRVKAVYLEPKADGLTVIGGRNGQGKTSVLDAIAWALGGDKMRPSNAKREDAARRSRSCAWCWTTASWWSARARTAR